MSPGSKKRVHSEVSVEADNQQQQQAPVFANDDEEQQENNLNFEGSAMILGKNYYYYYSYFKPKNIIFEALLRPELSCCLLAC